LVSLATFKPINTAMDKSAAGTGINGVSSFFEPKMN
jgi:hypothetical protein